MAGELGPDTPHIGLEQRNASLPDHTPAASILLFTVEGEIRPTLLSLAP